MKIPILFIGFLFVVFQVTGRPDFSAIDKRSKSVPARLKSPEAIAGYLTKDVISDEEKVRAIYIWISHNIRYDLAQLKSPRNYSSEDEIISEVLSRRRGVCQHYSELFHAMCQSVNITSYRIGGYTRQQDGKISDLSHAWNGVKIGREYYLVDVTWAAGYVQKNRYVHEFNDKFFLVSPRDFIKTHMPFDPIWQFLDNPINNSEFIKQDFSRISLKGEFMFADSIDAYQRLDKIGQLETMNIRIINSGVNLPLIRDEVEQNSLQIAYARFNLAIDALNSAVDNYNQYVNHKNKQFRNPLLAVEQIRELLSNTETGLSQADLILRELVSNNRDLNALVKAERRKMNGIVSAVAKEKAYVEKHFGGK